MNIDIDKATHCIKNKIPFIIRGGAKDMKAYSLWTDDYLRKQIGNKIKPVEISENKRFNPDSPTAKCYQKDMSVKEFLNVYKSGTHYLVDDDIDKEVINDTLRPDLLELMKTAGMKAYKKGPLDTLFFFGCSNNITPVHTDSYNNWYHLIDGEKDIAIISRRNTKAMRDYKMLKFNHCRLSLEELENLDTDKYPLLKNMKIHKYHMKKGDLLYIPYEFWHYMQGGSGRNIAVAIWY